MGSLGEEYLWGLKTLTFLLPCLTFQALISKYKFSTPVSIISWENLIKDQSINFLLCSSFLLILLTFSFDDVLI